MLPEVGPLIPMRTSLMAVLSSGGPIRVLREGSDSGLVPVAAERVTKSGRYLSSPPPSVGAGGSTRSPGFLGDVVASPPAFVGRADGEERSPYNPSRFGFAPDLPCWELNERDHDSCQVFVFRAQPEGEWEFVVVVTPNLLL